MAKEGRKDAGQTRPNGQAQGKREKPAAGKRKIGTDERPLETEYYDLLGLPITCTAEDVKKAYRRLYHPDKNPDDPAAADRFKEIAVAYTTLSDPKLRKQYNEFGKSKKDGGSADEAVDPEVIFSTLFGGERFQDIIGTISLGSEMKSAMQLDDSDDEDDPSTSSSTAVSSTTASSSSSSAAATKRPKKPLTPEQERRRALKAEQEAKLAAEKQKVREERVKLLSDKLRDKLALYAEQAQGEEDRQIADGVRTMWSIEAEELKKESYGIELLQAVGVVYQMKSKHYLASTGPVPFGIGGWFHAAKSTAHIFNQTVSTVRSAYALKDVYEEIQKAEQSGTLSEEEKRKLEDKAAQMGLHALFKGAKLEVESIIREVCDRLLTTLAPEEAQTVSPALLRKRAVALGILGEVYASVKKDPGTPDGPFGAFAFAAGSPRPSA
ncbi:chaperone regulator [Rhodotorula toruloides]|uniref:Chaperone regulator n=1 Tax=Rhodotorula toruloides TaxID=5286 RepID=A0A511K883_RHOTO|nr:chaperone regulator [Rhodotorula toruloides]